MKEFLLLKSNFTLLFKGARSKMYAQKYEKLTKYLETLC